eukprot:COSAG06_NODE_38644_length_421_cov_0.891304_1_plen_96_part_01
MVISLASRSCVASTRRLAPDPGRHEIWLGCWLGCWYMSLRLRFENLYLFVMFQSDDLGVHILDLIFRLVEAVSEAPLPHPYPLAVQTIVAELGTDI